MRYVGLVDCNNFFVSCERLFRPDLRTKPVVVLSSNDGCVVARSQEIKEAGISMGMPYFKVKKELSDLEAAVFSSNFPLYRDISFRVMSVLQDTIGSIEQYSVDEAFFNVAENQDIEQQMIDLRSLLERVVGIPVSIGVARTKTIAKYASEVAKKTSGVCFLEGDRWFTETENIPIYKIWGIGRQTSKKLQKQDIHTVSDFLNTDRGCIESVFGIEGLRIYDALSEKKTDVSGIGADQKSIMSTRSFSKSTHIQSEVEDALAYHVAHVAQEIRKKGLVAQYIHVLARASRYSTWSYTKSSDGAFLVRPTDDTRELLKEALRLFRSFYNQNVPYKKAGVVLGGLFDKRYAQKNLFTEFSGDIQDTTELMSALDTLNSRYGKDIVTIGRVQSKERWKSSSEYISPSYTTKWDELASVRA